MILHDILDVLNVLTEDQRELVLSGLLDQLTIYSHYAILEGQLTWNGELPYEEFVKFLDEIIIGCIKAEMSPLGIVLRREQGFEPLSYRTEINL